MCGSMLPRMCLKSKFIIIYFGFRSSPGLRVEELLTRSLANRLVWYNFTITEKTRNCVFPAIVPEINPERRI